ncbi:MAG: transposase [Treponema sp.]|jgi:transposase|nr:transposase [Treponema sp.]
MTDNGCKWRALPERFWNWYTVYVRLDRWSRNGVLERVYAALAAEGLTGGQGTALMAPADCVVRHNKI